MAIALSGTLALVEAPTHAARLPRIGYANHFEDGTVTASSEQTDHPASMAIDAFTDTAWIGVEGEGSWWIRVSQAGAAADYAGLFAWDLTGITITLQSSDDGGTVWDDVAAPVMSTDRVVVFLFDEAQHDDWRILFTGATPPEVAHVALGQATVLEIGVPIGFEPPRQARNNQILNNETEQGHLVGRSVLRTGIATTLTLQYVSEDWVRSTWEPFIDHAELRPFYLVWSPVKWPEEAAFLWTRGRIRSPRYSSPRHMEVQLQVQGFAR